METGFPEEALKFMRDFYARHGKTDADVREKVDFLKRVIGGDVHIYACGGEVTDQMALNNLEYEYLCKKGALDRVLC